MRIDQVFYLYYLHQCKDCSTKKLIVFYDKDTLAPQMAYELHARNSIPKAYRMLSMMYINRKQFNDLINWCDDLGILQTKGAAISEPEK